MKPKDNIEKLIENKGFEFRNFKLSNMEVRKKEDGTNSLEVEGVPCVYDTETVLYKGKYYECREQIASDAFDEADMTDVIFNMNHCGRVYARTRNNSLQLESKEDGLHMKAQLRSSDAGHQQMFDDIQSGLLDRMSFAFTVAESKFEYIERDGEPTIELRTITKIDKLYDVSAVDIPAYDTTSISARSAFDAEREKRQSERDAEAREVQLALARYNYINS